MKLHNLVNVLTNDRKTVVLQVKPFCGIGLVSLGGFTGKETSFRITKGANPTIVIKEGSITKAWIDENDERLSERTRKMAKLIRECVELDFGIHVGTDDKRIAQTTHIRQVSDQYGTPCKVAIRYFEECNPGVMMYKNDEFLKHFNDLSSAKKFIRDNFKVIRSKQGMTLTNGLTETFECFVY